MKTGKGHTLTPRQALEKLLQSIQKVSDAGGTVKEIESFATAIAPCVIDSEGDTWDAGVRQAASIVRAEAAANASLPTTNVVLTDLAKQLDGVADHYPGARCNEAQKETSMPNIGTHPLFDTDRPEAAKLREMAVEHATLHGVAAGPIADLLARAHAMGLFGTSEERRSKATNDLNPDKMLDDIGAAIGGRVTWSEALDWVRRHRRPDAPPSVADRGMAFVREHSVAMQIGDQVEVARALGAVLAEVWCDGLAAARRESVPPAPCSSNVSPALGPYTTSLIDAARQVGIVWRDKDVESRTLAGTNVLNALIVAETEERHRSNVTPNVTVALRAILLLQTRGALRETARILGPDYESLHAAHGSIALTKRVREEAITALEAAESDLTVERLWEVVDEAADLVKFMREHAEDSSGIASRVEDVERALKDVPKRGTT